MLSRGRIIKGGETLLFDMPSLKRTFSGRQRDGEDMALERAQRADAVEREAYERGFAAGEKAGIEMGEEKAAVMLGRLESLLRDMQEMKENVIGEIEPQLLDLAKTIARRIIMEELTQNPEMIVGMVKEAIRKLERTGTITVKLNPGLHDLFLRLRPEILEIHPDIVYEVDPSVPLTGPLVTSEKEVVVTDIDEQLGNIGAHVEDSSGRY